MIHIGSHAHFTRFRNDICDHIRMVIQARGPRFKPWRLVCVDFPGGKTWGFDQLEAAAGGPVGVITVPQELRSLPCVNSAAAIADTVPRDGVALAVVGHCTTFGLVCGVVRALRQQGCAPVGLVVDPQPVTAASLAEELRTACAMLCGGRSNGFVPAAMTPTALDSWIGDATALLRAGAAENPALSSLSATTREQFVERYRDWFAHLAASSLGETADAVATFPDASAASSLLEDAFVVASTE
jgi:hypothetical protein